MASRVTARVCIVVSNSAWRALPRALASYMAASASRSSASDRSCRATPVAMPMLAVTKTDCPGSSKGGSSRLSIRLATATASWASAMSGSSTVNSSPPRRARVSPSRRQPASRWATSQRSWSPASWPRLSLRRSAFVYPDKVAVVHGERRYSYREFHERVNRLASALAGAGVEAGDRVAFLCPNIPALLEAHFAVPAAGAVLVAVNTRLAAGEVAYILEHAGARIVFCDHELVELVEGCDVEVVRVDDTGAPGDPYEDFLATGSPQPFERPLIDEEQTISINYTSGTTGRPKGVMYTYRGAYLNALMEALQSNLRPESVQLWVVPMFHCNGWCFPWAVTAMGARHVCLRRVDPAAMWDLFDAEGITHYNGAPTVRVGLVNHPAAHRLEREVTVTTGGAPPSPTLLARMAALNLRPVHVYGVDRDLRPLHRLRGPAGLGRARRRGARAPAGAPGQVRALPAPRRSRSLQAWAVLGPCALLAGEPTGPPRARRPGPTPSPRPRTVVTASVQPTSWWGLMPAILPLTTCAAMQHVGEHRAHPAPLP